MKTIAIAALIGAVAAENLFLNNEVSDIEHEFLKYVAENRKNYGTQEEYNFRLDQFAQNFQGIMEVNQTNGSFTTALNQFADWTPQEYKQILGFRQEANTFRAAAPVMLEEVAADFSVDWRKKNAVTPVKNQGQCGSCWSFSTTGAVEGAHAIATGSLKAFSEQQLVDCATMAAGYGSMGCQGGQMTGGTQYIIDNGDNLESNYAYTAKDGTCEKEVVAKGETGIVSSYHMVAQNNMEQLKAAVAKGPVSVAIEADQFPFQFYSGGVLDSVDCGTQLDHGVLVAGFGTEGGKDYYLVKNSWGPTWGESGYIKIAAVEGAGICGIQMQPLLPQA